MLVASLILGSVGAASDQAQPERKLKQLRDHIGQLKTGLDKKYSHRGALRNALEQTEKQLGEIQNTVQKLNDKARRLQREIDELQTDRLRMRTRLGEHNALFARQIRLAYGLGNEPYLKLLLNQQDPAEVSRTIAYYSYLHAARRRAIQTLAGQLRLIEELDAQMRQRQEELAATATEMTQQRAVLAEQRAERQRILDQVLTQIADTEGQLRQLASDEAELVELIDGLRRYLADKPASPGGSPGESLLPRGSFAGAQGKLPWPVKGRLVAKFGESRNLGGMRWSGVVLQASRGSEVRSVFQGQVAFADWMRGFGLLIIVNHGNGYMSLYGNNDSLHKQVGDPVGAGEVIARVGDSGGRKEPGLYFEIRADGKPRDPQQWCRG